MFAFHLGLRCDQWVYLCISHRSSSRQLEPRRALRILLRLGEEATTLDNLAAPFYICAIVLVLYDPFYFEASSVLVIWISYGFVSGSECLPISTQLIMLSPSAILPT